MVINMNTVKPTKGKDLEIRARQSLEDMISEVPFVEKKRMRASKVGDFKLEIVVSGRPFGLIVEVKSQGEPRIIRAAVIQLRDSLQSKPTSHSATYGIIVAPYLSANSIQICKEAGVGCLDLAGNAFLSFGSIYIERKGGRNPFAASRIAKSIFSPKSSRISRVLLSNPSRKWFVEEISKEAGISIGLASRIKKSLFAMEWIEEENKKFYLAKPDELIDEWVKTYSYTQNGVESFYSEWSLEDLEKSLSRECEKRKLRYGLALFSGARKVAPFVRSLRFFAYIEDGMEDLASALEFKRVDSGPNVTLLSPFDEGVFYGLQRVQDFDIVSDIQLYLDLKSYKGRGEEAAKAIFEQRIRTRW